MNPTVSIVIPCYKGERFLEEAINSCLTQTFMSLMLSRRKYVVSGPTGSRAIAITFDDGPHPVHTPEVLDVLRRRRAFATFFLVGRAAEAHPDLVRRILDEGHGSSSHSGRGHSRTIVIAV